MAVNFTPNIGLAKPTESELALNWARSTKLAEDNNLIIEAKMNIPLTAYTPAFIGATTNPNVGAGEIKGEYIEVEGFIFGSFNIIFVAPGISAGSGTGGYGIQLPTLVDDVFHRVGTSLLNAPGVYSCIGEGYYSDSSSVPTSGTVALDAVEVAGIDYLRMHTEAIVGKTETWVGPGHPSTVADQDQLSGSFWYKKL